MNTILIAVIAITIWQLVYTVAANVSKENDLVMSIIGGGIWLIPIIIINKIFLQIIKKGVDKSLNPCYNNNRKRGGDHEN